MSFQDFTKCDEMDLILTTVPGGKRRHYQESTTRERPDLNSLVRPDQPAAEQSRCLAAAPGHAEELAQQAEAAGQCDAQKIGASRLLGLRLEDAAEAARHPLCHYTAPHRCLALVSFADG